MSPLLDADDTCGSRLAFLAAVATARSLNDAAEDMHTVLGPSDNALAVLRHLPKPPSTTWLKLFRLSWPEGSKAWLGGPSILDAASSVIREFDSPLFVLAALQYAFDRMAATATSFNQAEQLITWAHSIAGDADPGAPFVLYVRSGLRRYLTHRLINTLEIALLATARGVGTKALSVDRNCMLEDRRLHNLIRDSLWSIGPGLRVYMLSELAQNEVFKSSRRVKRWWVTVTS